MQILYGGGEVTHTELVKDTGLSSGGVSAMVNQLEVQGLVGGRPDDRDGRVLRISLTQLGVDELGAVQADWLRRFDAAFADLNDADLAIVRNGLDRVTRIVDSIAVEEPPRPRGAVVGYASHRVRATPRPRTFSN